MSMDLASFFRRIALTAALTGVAAVPALAQVHKCTGSDGAVVYQEAPCGSTSGIRSAPAVPGKSADKTKASDAKAMNDAYQSRMDKQDYDGALAFATTDQQKAQARKKAEDKRVKCESLSTKAKEAQAQFERNGLRWQPKAEAAQAEYRTHCK